MISFLLKAADFFTANLFLSENSLKAPGCRRKSMHCYSFLPLLSSASILPLFNSSPITLFIGFLVVVIFTLSILWFSEKRKKRRYYIMLETKRKEMLRTSQLLKISEERYYQLIHNINEGLVITDLNNMIRFANNSACNILQIAPENLINKSLKSLIFGGAEVLKHPSGKDKSLPAPHCEEVQIVTGGNKIIWVRLSISYPLSGSPGNQQGAVIVLTDINKRKEAEQERNSLTADLNQKIRQLHCLFDILDITGAPGITFDGIFNRCLEVIPNGLKYSHDVCIEISFEEKRYASANYAETPWNMTVPIRVQKKKLGQIKIGYIKERPKIKKDPFHINEKILLKNIAEKLGQIIESRHVQQKNYASEYGKSNINK